MAFQPLSDWAFGDDAGLQVFLLAHALEHEAFYQALLGQTPPFAATNMDIAVLKDPKNPKDWLAAHQLVSQSQWTGAGGGQSPDLGSVDWSKADQLDDWQQYHASWHQTMRQSLGL